MTVVRTALVLTGAILLSGCSPNFDPDSPAVRAFRYKAGQTESELTANAGPPQSERRVEGLGVCRPPAVRELTYEMKWSGWDKVVGDWLHVSPGAFTTVCVDDDKVITAVYTIVN